MRVGNKLSHKYKHLFLQFLSSLLQTNVDRPTIIETTALGAAYLAGYQAGVFASMKEIASKWKSEKVFVQKLHKKEVKYLHHFDRSGVYVTACLNR